MEEINEAVASKLAVNVVECMMLVLVLVLEMSELKNE